MLRDAAEAPRYRLLATTPAELILDNQLTQGVDARRLHRWLASDTIEIRTVACDTALPWLAVVGGVLLVGNAELTRECLDPAYAMPQAGLFAPDEASRAALAAVYERLWAQGTDVKAPLRAALAALYAPNAPRFIYFLSLWHLFHDRLPEWRGAFADDRRLEETPIWKALYAFQRHGAIAALRKLKKDGGCILADSVGLGKTYTALAVIKAYERMGTGRILVLCPKKLRPNWERFLRPDEYNPFSDVHGDPDFRFYVMSHTDLLRQRADVGRGTVDVDSFLAKGFSLIVIDESHNFKSKVKKYNRLLQTLVAHPETKLLMLSATPVNTRLMDLTNQLGLIYRVEDGKPIPPAFTQEVSSVLKKAHHCVKEWGTARSKGEIFGNQPLASVMPKSFFDLVERFSIARSRKGLKQFYLHDLVGIGNFPKRETREFFPALDTEGKVADFESLYEELDKLTLVAYNPTDCLAAGVQLSAVGAGNLSDASRQKSLAALTRVNALKRLESSIHSFRKTISETVLARTQKQLQALDRRRVILPRITAETLDELAYEESEEILGSVEVPSYLFNERELRWQLTEDCEIALRLLAQAEQVDCNRDEKLRQLRRELETKIDSRYGIGCRKALIFTAFADTAEYLAASLSLFFPEVSVACITGSSGKVYEDGQVRVTEPGEILRRFAPKAQEWKPRSPLDKLREIEWVVSTDCLSEGQNLQDCDLVVNYDIHWNPLRLTQRAGRIDRIGSEHKTIFIDYFWPCKELGRYLQLEERVRTRGALIDTFGGEDMEFRQGQLTAIREGRLGEESIIVNRHETFEEYLAELDGWLRMDARNEKECRNTPSGLCAVTSAALVDEFADSGVPIPRNGGAIFLLRRSGLSIEEQKSNPFGDLFLLVVNETGCRVVEERLSEERALALFRALCRDRADVNNELVNRFEKMSSGSLTRMLNGALKELEVNRESCRAQLLLGDEPFDFHSGLTDGLGSLTLVTLTVILPEAKEESVRGKSGKESLVSGVAYSSPMTHDVSSSVSDTMSNAKSQERVHKAIAIAQTVAGAGKNSVFCDGEPTTWSSKYHRREELSYFLGISLKQLMRALCSRQQQQLRIWEDDLVFELLRGAFSWASSMNLRAGVSYLISDYAKHDYLKKVAMLIPVWTRKRTVRVPRSWMAKVCTDH